MANTQQHPAAAGGALARLDRLYSKLEDGLNYIAGVIVFALMLFVCAEVSGRTIFNHSIYGFLDLTELTYGETRQWELDDALRRWSGPTTGRSRE